jgi:hypothetical protein
VKDRATSHPIDENGGRRASFSNLSKDKGQRTASFLDGRFRQVLSFISPKVAGHVFG